MAGSCGYGEELSGSINAGNFLTICKVYWLASQEGLCSMEYVSKKFHGIDSLHRLLLRAIRSRTHIYTYVCEGQHAPNL